MMGAGLVFFPEKDRITVVRIFGNSPASAAGIKPGDEVIAVNNVHKESIRDIGLDTAFVCRKESGFLHLTLARDGNQFSVRLPCRPISTVFWNSLDRYIGYLAIYYFENDTPTEFASILPQIVRKRGLVLDLRDNPGGKKNALDRIGEILFPNVPSLISVLQKVVLVNGRTASAAEILAANLQDKGALVIGEKTYGKFHVNSYPKYSLEQTVLGKEKVFTRKGRDLDGIGVAPDIVETDNPMQIAEQVLRDLIRVNR